MNKKSIFALAFLAGLLLVLAVLYANRTPAVAAIQMQPLTTGIYVAGQVAEAEVSALKKGGIATIVDLRPDDEAPDQPSSSVISAEADKHQMVFHYIPVQAGKPIPDSTVTALGEVLASSPKPILLYCRSGNRAARSFALVEASRIGGADAAAILAMTKSAGHAVDDLSARINERIARRVQK